MPIVFGAVLPVVTLLLALIERNIEIANPGATARLKTKRTLVGLLAFSCVGSIVVAVRQGLDAKEQDKELKAVRATLRGMSTQQAAFAEQQTRIEESQTQLVEKQDLPAALQEHILEGYLNHELSAEDPHLTCCLHISSRAGNINDDGELDVVTWFVFQETGGGNTWGEGLAAWVTDEEGGLRYIGWDVIGGRFGGHLAGIEFRPGRVIVETKGDPMWDGELDRTRECAIRGKVRCQ